MSTASDDDEYRKAVSKYSASFMSNSKWLRLFRAVIAANIELPQVQWSFIDSAHSVWNRFPLESDLRPKRFADGAFQPFGYRWIESVFIPHAYRPVRDVGFERRQDTQAVIDALKSVGQFEVESTEDGITIFGYKE